MNIKILYYAAGHVKEYFDGLQEDPQKKPAAIRLKTDLLILKAEGLRSQQIDIKPLKSIYKNLWELRRKHDNVQYRIYIAVSKGIFWLIHYLEKETQKIPQKDVELLRKRAREAEKL